MKTNYRYLLALCALAILTVIACGISQPSPGELPPALPAPDDLRDTSPDTSVPSVDIPQEESQTENFPNQEQPDLVSDGFQPPDEDLNEAILQEVSFFAGGAGCGMKNIGVSGKTCMASDNWPIVLKITGVFRVSDQGGPEQTPWWGEKYDSCYSTLQFGDMVYFMAQGYPEGEEVRFTIEGPNGEETYTIEVRKNVKYEDQRTCAPFSETSAARLSWVANPKLGAGNYRLTVTGNAGRASLDFRVDEASSPNFGVSVGDTSLPLVLGPERKIKLVYSGFSPNEIVTTLLYRADVDTHSEELVRYIDVQMDGNGSAVNIAPWDSSLPAGDYWLLVPSMLPNVSTPSESRPPALWAVYFYANTSPVYDADRLAANTQDIFLRPSCGKEQKVKADKVINLQYGVWGVNGGDILNATKDKVITRLFINDEEIVGYRSESFLSMAQIPCGDYLDNGTFLYNEAQIGPFYSWDRTQDVNIRVEFSFTGEITDGYDLSPQDGQNDLYSPATSFSQTYKLIVVP